MRMRLRCLPSRLSVDLFQDDTMRLIGILGLARYYKIARDLSALGINLLMNIICHSSGARASQAWQSSCASRHTALLPALYPPKTAQSAESWHGRRIFPCQVY